MKKTARILSLLLVALTLVSLAGTALAASAKPAIAPRTLWAGCEYFSCVDFVNMPENAEIISIKSSKPSVIKAYREDSGIYDNYLVPLKAGTSKITVKYKLNGKTTSISGTYTVKKYPNPLTSVTVNGAKINIKANKYYYDFNKYTKTKTMVTLKLAKGWKVGWTWGYTEDPQNEDTFKEFKPKSGKAFTIKKGYDGAVFFTLVNSKGEELQYGIHFNRG